MSTATSSSTATSQEPEVTSSGAPLALPPPPPEGETEQITVNGGQTFKFDKLGPIVVNSDGVRGRHFWLQGTAY